MLRFTDSYLNILQSAGNPVPSTHLARLSPLPLLPFSYVLMGRLSSIEKLKDWSTIYTNLSAVSVKTAIKKAQIPPKTSPYPAARPTLPEEYVDVDRLAAEAEYPLWLQEMNSHMTSNPNDASRYLMIEDPLHQNSMSRFHIIFKQEKLNSSFSFKDLGSLNGIYLNDNKVPSNVWIPLTEGDKLRFAPRTRTAKQHIDRYEMEKQHQKELENRKKQPIVDCRIFPNSDGSNMCVTLEAFQISDVQPLPPVLLPPLTVKDIHVEFEFTLDILSYQADYVRRLNQIDVQRQGNENQMDIQVDPVVAENKQGIKRMREEEQEEEKKEETNENKRMKQETNINILLNNNINFSLSSSALPSSSLPLSSFSPPSFPFFSFPSSSSISSSLPPIHPSSSIPPSSRSTSKAASSSTRYTAYNVFTSQMKNEVKRILEERGDLNHSGFAKEMSVCWKKLSNEEKSKYYKIAEEHKTIEKQKLLQNEEMNRLSSTSNDYNAMSAAAALTSLVVVAPSQPTESKMEMVKEEIKEEKKEEIKEEERKTDDVEMKTEEEVKPKEEIKVNEEVKQNQEIKANEEIKVNEEVKSNDQVNSNDEINDLNMKQENKSSLPSTSSSSNPNISSLLDEFQCGICMNVIYKCVVLTCSHSFCKNCIDQWFTKKKLCPVCREPHKGLPAAHRSVDNVINTLVSHNFTPAELAERQQRIKQIDAETKEREEKLAQRKELLKERKQQRLLAMQAFMQQRQSAIGDMNGVVIDDFIDVDDDNENDQGFNVDAYRAIIQRHQQQLMALNQNNNRMVRPASPIPPPLPSPRPPAPRANYSFSVDITTDRRSACRLCYKMIDQNLLRLRKQANLPVGALPQHFHLQCYVQDCQRNPQQTKLEMRNVEHSIQSLDEHHKLLVRQIIG